MEHPKSKSTGGFTIWMGHPVGEKESMVLEIGLLSFISFTSLPYPLSDALEAWLDGADHGPSILAVFSHVINFVPGDRIKEASQVTSNPSFNLTRH